MEVEITYATKGLLRDINRQAIENGFEFAWDPQFLETLPEAHYPVYQTAFDHLGHVRITFLLDRSGTEAPLDMSFDEYEHLPIDIFDPDAPEYRN
jgi:hypothetical protein